MRALEDYERRGDYLVPRDTLEDAQERFEGRSERSQALDRSLRAPITVDYSKWKKTRGRRLDYPGVDTPTNSPSMMPYDHEMPIERHKVFTGTPTQPEDAIMSERPTRVRPRPPIREQAIDKIEGAAQEVWEISGRVSNVLQPGSVPYAYQEEQPEPGWL